MSAFAIVCAVKIAKRFAQSVIKHFVGIVLVGIVMGYHWMMTNVNIVKIKSVEIVEMRKRIIMFVIAVIILYVIHAIKCHVILGIVRYVIKHFVINVST